MFRTALCLGVVWFGLATGALAQITVNGVTDRGNYPETVTFTVAEETGYAYSAFLNTNSVPTGVPVTVNRPDFYELRVFRTQDGTGATSSLYLRFLVIASERADTESGLPRQFAWPLVTSSLNEFAGTRLRLLAPSRFPVGHEIPVVAWVEDDAGHAVRGNGFVAAEGHASIQVRRGVGSGFLAATNSAGELSYGPSIQGVATNKTITLEANTTWTPVAGTLSGDVSWPENSRIHVTTNITVNAGATVTIGAGTIVRLNSRCDITNNGAVVINGTRENPVVFMPNTRSQPWGGFTMRSGPASVTGTGVIFTGSGAIPNWFGTGGNPGSHRTEQALFFVNDAQSVSLTDSAAIYLAGQLSHAVSGGTFTFDHFLMQRVTSGGEFTGSTWNVNDSAFIECPDDSVDFDNGDNDALYFVSGRQNFTNTLFGWTKDDIIDCGGSGYGTLHFQSCWFEAAAHEGNALSGYKNVFPRDTVYLGCGQGFEDGYNSPTGRLAYCLITDNLSGLRHGDNYPSIGDYAGTLAATNCIVLYNHRDIFGFNWRTTGWTNAVGQIFAYDNWLTRPDTNFPNNLVWNPATDGWRLAAFGAKGHVGVGFATRPGQPLLTEYPGPYAGGEAVVPVGLSIYCTNEVTVDYTIDTTDGTSERGTLVFPAGRTRHHIRVPGGFNGVLRVALENPVNADLTGETSILLQRFSAGRIVLSPLGATWKYLDNGSDQGTAWRAPEFNDSSWPEGPGRLGFGTDAAATTTVRRYLSGTSGPQVTNYYFRRAFVVTNDLAELATIQFRYQRDDGCVLYLNGAALFTNNMPAGPITFQTFASTTISPASETQRFHTNTFAASLLRPGTNVVAVEVHQSTATSSDIAWEMELAGVPAATAPQLNLWRVSAGATSAEPLILYWPDTAFGLQEAEDISGPWRDASTTNSPVSITPEGTRFFRLRR
jgi:hypothetical protein